MMNILDVTILYFAIGAPFGAFHYFELRNRKDKKFVLLESFLTSIFWIRSAIKIFRSKSPDWFGSTIKSSPKPSQNLKVEQEVFKFHKEIEKLFVTNKSNGSIYEFREAVERYTGLSLAIQNVKRITPRAKYKNAKMIFPEIANNFVSEACHLRRNHKLLSFHHNLARQEFCGIINRMLVNGADEILLAKVSVEFARVLNDSEGQKLISQMLDERRQTIPNASVTNSENDLWKTGKLKPSLDNQVLINFKTTSAISISKD
jgi:hypothetical protein